MWLMAAGGTELGLCPVATAHAAPPGPDLVYLENFEQALQAGARAQRLVMVVLTSTQFPDQKPWADSILKEVEVKKVSHKWLFVHNVLDKSEAVLKKYNLERKVPQILFVLPNGTVVEKVEGKLPPRQLSRDMAHALDKLEQPFRDEAEKGLNSSNKSSQKSALTKLSQLSGGKSTQLIAERAFDEDVPVDVRVAAVQGLAKQGRGGVKLVPIMGDPNRQLRDAAVAAVKANGEGLVFKVLPGLTSDNPDLRASAFQVLSVLAKFPKRKAETFWRTGPEDERKALADEWAKWWQTNRPAWVVDETDEPEPQNP